MGDYVPWASIARGFRECYTTHSSVHGMYQCEVSMMIPFNPTETWSGSIIGSEPNTGVEMMEHIALTSLCEDRLAATVALHIVLLPIWN
jgi:hypothetical protein